MGNWQSAISILGQIKQSELVQLNVFHYSTAITACSVAGQLQPALDLLKEMKGRKIAPNVYTFTSLITACAKTGNVEQALQLFAEMRLVNVPPNVKTITALITACARAGEWQRAIRILNSSARTMEIAPNVRTYTAAIEACRRAGACEPALELLKSMNNPLYTVPNEVTYHTALGCCVKSQNVSAAQRIFARMVASGFTPLPYAKELLRDTFLGSPFEGMEEYMEVRSRKERKMFSYQPDVDPGRKERGEHFGGMGCGGA